METWQINLDWEHQVNSLVEVYFGGLVVRGNYVQPLAIVTKFKGLGGAKT